MTTRFSCGCRNILTEKGVKTYVCDEVKDEDMKSGDKRVCELEKEKHTRKEGRGVKKLILHLCADTGSDTKPYKDNGYEVILVGKDIGVENYHPPENVYGIIANPVCTEFTTARSTGKARNPDKGFEMVKECQRIIGECKNLKFWVIENPAKGELKKYLGKPRYKYQPWWYGSPWCKETALWGKFNIPDRKFYNWNDVPKIPELYCRPTRKKPSLAFNHKNHKRFIREFDCFDVDSDMEFRSLCSQKFAQAFYKANL